ncbi:MAG: hypothetical protein K9I94_00270 [Bacteroidales bacterium]|nr:hypothetical protein [Bacteroidales bacterium]
MNVDYTSAQKKRDEDNSSSSMVHLQEIINNQHKYNAAMVQVIQDIREERGIWSSEKYPHTLSQCSFYQENDPDSAVINKEYFNLIFSTVPMIYYKRIIGHIIPQKKKITNQKRLHNIKNPTDDFDL